ncbi:hypothetical protein SEVIR_5G340775v4 [Setaria viridis]
MSRSTSGLCLSSATLASSPTTAIDDGVSLPSGGGTSSGSGVGAAVVGGSGSGSGGNGAAGGGNCGAGVGGNCGAAGGGNVGQQGLQGTYTTNAIIIEGDEPAPVEDDQHCGKRQKRCTSDVWQYFTKKRVVIEDNGKTYVQVWAHCKWLKCKHKGRCESNYGTTGFWTHPRMTHSIVKGQQQLKVEKDEKKDITFVVPYRYDEDASLRKFYLAIVMHEYPFNISEHEYFVEFIKSLRSTFLIRSRVTIRKEIMNMFLAEK